MTTSSSARMTDTLAAPPWLDWTSLIGPAFVAAIAYVDPGNFATNFQAGALLGYRLVWVVIAASIVATFIQYLSAKLGLATGKDLPSLCREQLKPTTRVFMWVQAEIVAVATDLAEFVGAAIGLNLLFGIPPAVAALITAGLSFILLGLHARGERQFELVIAIFLALIGLGFGYTVVASGHQSATGIGQGLLPSLPGHEAVFLAVGILGATVMPHVIYLHSSLTARRGLGWSGEARRRALRSLRLDTALGLGIAGVINVAMLCVASATFHGRGSFDGSLEGIHRGFAELVGGGTALMFAASLLASGLSSSGVGTLSGQVIMQGLLKRKVPLLVRRTATMAPAVAIFLVGINPGTALLISQVVLAFGIPFALAPLAMFTRRRDLMGDLVNRRSTTIAAFATCLAVVALNAVLLVGLL